MRAQYIGEDSEVTLAPQPFLIFCTTICLSIQQSLALNKVHYLADGDVSKVT